MICPHCCQQMGLSGFAQALQLKQEHERGLMFDRLREENRKLQRVAAAAEQVLACTIYGDFASTHAEQIEAIRLLAREHRTLAATE